MTRSAPSGSHDRPDALVGSFDQADIELSDHIPVHPEDRWWSTLKRRRRVWTLPTGALMVADSDAFVDWLRAGVVSKAGLREAIRDRCPAGDLELIGQTALILLDGPRHVTIRRALDRFWADGSRSSVENSLAAHIIELVRGPTESSVDEVVRLVLACITGVSVESQTMTDLLELAPLLNDVMTDRIPPSLQGLTQLATSLLDDLSERAGNPARRSLFGMLRAETDLAQREIAGVVLFVATAAVETMRSLVRMCMLEARRTYRRTARELLAIASPVPYALYGFDRNVDGLIDAPTAGRPVAFCLQHPTSAGQGLTFGYGAHYCWGARLALLTADTLLEHLPIQASDDRPFAWSTERFTRDLHPVERH